MQIQPKAIAPAFFGLTALAAACFAGPAAAESVEDFYKGKTIQMVIGYSAGGGYDTYARAVGRHLGRNIPGAPTIVPQNMPGAGSRTAANWLYSVAPQDGTAIGTVGQNTPLDQALREKGVKFDVAKFNWIGNTIVDNNFTLAWADAGFDTLKAAIEKGGLICGGTGAASPSILYPQILNNLLDAKIRIISGYPGGSAANLAMERGEINCRGSNSWSSTKATLPQWMKDKKFDVLVEWGLESNPEIAEYQGRPVPLVTELAKNEADRKALELIVSSVAMGRPLVAPPGVPDERVEALRRAFDRTMKDPEFLAEAEKLRMDVNPLAGEKVQKVAADTVSAPDEVVQRARSLIERRDVEALKKQK